MMPLVAILTFAGAAGLSVGTIVLMVAPQWRRIARLASGQVEAGFAPVPACES